MGKGGKMWWGKREIKGPFIDFKCWGGNREEGVRRVECQGEGRKGEKGRERGRQRITENDGGCEAM